jgi:hypothetical protein
VPAGTLFQDLQHAAGPNASLALLTVFSDEAHFLNNMMAYPLLSGCPRNACPPSL